VKGFQICRSEIDARELRMEIKAFAGIKYAFSSHLMQIGDPNPIVYVMVLCGMSSENHTPRNAKMKRGRIGLNWSMIGPMNGII
jgi:hypothetical protein